MTTRQFTTMILVSAATSLGSIWGFSEYQQFKNEQMEPLSSAATVKTAEFANYAVNTAEKPMVDFEKAATKATPAVVHIKTLTKAKKLVGDPNLRNSPLREFFGDGYGMFEQRINPEQFREQRASGSGVIVTSDGYIVTNNHVVANADELLVTLSNRKDYKAKIIGTDPSTDLAVIKIEGNEFPYLTFANSDDVHLGQWVLAIGYPLNLETTVTSGIVSAKSRSLGINGRQSNTPVEAFIQTDAAVNPGNSGGALVNTDGNVIGINSAIASPTGSYAGYSYAIPSNMVKKIVTDIMKYGSTKRAYLGVMYGSDLMSAEDRRKNNIKEGEGVYVMEVAPGSAADEAGVKKSDFITHLNGVKVNTGTQMIEKIAALRPGDEISLTYQQNGREKTASVELKGDPGNYERLQQSAE